jgi:hypothetical protein
MIVGATIRVWRCCPNDGDGIGTWVFHCHILSHVESEMSMFGMMTALIVT